MPATMTPPLEVENEFGVDAGGSREIDGGVIEEARSRQRRRRRRLAIAAVSLLTAALALVLARGGGGGSSASGGSPAAGAPLRLTFVAQRPYVNGLPFQLAVSPSLQAGNVGLCVAAQGHGESCGAYAGPGRPLVGDEGFSPEAQVGARGEVDFTLTGPGVAAVHVKDLGTFKTLPLSGLPPGDRAAVFYRPPGSLGTLLPPGAGPGFLTRVRVPAPHGGPARLMLPRAVTQTLLDGAGRAIPIRTVGTAFQLPSSYWQAPSQPPAEGRCALASRLSGVSVQWGEVATQIAPDRAVSGSAFLTCLQAWFTLGHSAFQAAVLLNAQSPGRTPAPLWGATPVAGSPGVVQIKAVEYRRPPLNQRRAAQEVAQVRRERGATAARQAARSIARLAAASRWIVLAPASVARRLGDAWLLVQDGGSLRQRIAFLDSLHLTRIDLSPGLR